MSFLQLTLGPTPAWVKFGPGLGCPQAPPPHSVVTRCGVVHCDPAVAFHVRSDTESDPCVRRWAGGRSGITDQNQNTSLPTASPLHRMRADTVLRGSDLAWPRGQGLRVSRSARLPCAVHHARGTSAHLWGSSFACGVKPGRPQIWSRSAGWSGLGSKLKGVWQSRQRRRSRGFWALSGSQGRPP